MPPKLPQLYNHNARPLTTRQLGLSTGLSGRSTVSVVSRQISTTAEPPQVPPHNDYMDLDEDFMNPPEAPDPGEADYDNNDNDGEEPTAEHEEIEQIFPGVHLKGVVKKVKRYESSV